MLSGTVLHLDPLNPKVGVIGNLHVLRSGIWVVPSFKVYVIDSLHVFGGGAWVDLSLKWV